MTPTQDNFTYSDMPGDPPDIHTAVKDYMVWLYDPKFPLDHRFEELKRRIISKAIDLVEKGKL